MSNDITIPLFDEICLKIGPVFRTGEIYPTSRLQKGLILISSGQDLAEEGVGFGVPVLKLGVKTVFPGEIELARFEDGPRLKITAIYLMNLEERLTNHRLGNVKSESLYWIKNHLEYIYQRFPPSRGTLMALSNALRSSFGWQTTFVDAGWERKIKVTYDIDAGKGVIKVDVETFGLTASGVTEVFLMNEQGAHHFDMYSDSSGKTLKGDMIGSWDEVTAERASFISSTHHVAFCLQQTDEARLRACPQAHLGAHPQMRLFRGRELVGSRLAWSGFGYSLPVTCQRFTYMLRIERLAFHAEH